MAGAFLTSTRDTIAPAAMADDQFDEDAAFALVDEAYAINNFSSPGGSAKGTTKTANQSAPGYQGKVGAKTTFSGAEEMDNPPQGFHPAKVERTRFGGVAALSFAAPYSSPWKLKH